MQSFLYLENINPAKKKHSTLLTKNFFNHSKETTHYKKYFYQISNKKNEKYMKLNPTQNFHKRCSSCLSLTQRYFQSNIKKKIKIENNNDTNSTSVSSSRKNYPYLKKTKKFSTPYRNNDKINLGGEDSEEKDLSTELKHSILVRSFSTKRKIPNLIKNINNEVIEDIFGEEEEDNIFNNNNKDNTINKKYLLNMKTQLIPKNHSVSTNNTLINVNSISAFHLVKSNNTQRVNDNNKPIKIHNVKFSSNNGIKKLFHKKIFEKQKQSYKKANSFRNDTKQNVLLFFKDRKENEDNNEYPLLRKNRINTYYEKKINDIKNYSFTFPENKFLLLKKMVKIQDNIKNKFLYDIKKDCTMTENDLKLKFVLLKRYKSIKATHNC